MEIFYESLCPDSMRFLTQQLVPIYDDFKDVLDITLYPHGKSNVSIQRFELTEIVLFRNLIL